jgi:NAD(P)H-nitrite reductase
VSDQKFEYIIIGGGLAGGNAALEIRNRNKEKSVLLITSEREYPYDRVPLSKEYLRGTLSKDKLFLKSAKFYEENSIKVILGKSATRINPRERSVTLQDGSVYRFEKLLIATGGSVKRLNIEGSELSGVHYLRTIEDCDKIKEQASRSKRVVVIGGGFIGCEVASSLSSIGLETWIVEIAPFLLPMAIDQETGVWLKNYYERKGVYVLTSTGVKRFLGEEGRVKAVETTTGDVLKTDFVVVGVGIYPNTQLAQDAGLKVDRGIVVNEYLETTEEGIYAAGDVARFYSPIFSRHLRVEHYDVAVKQGRIAAANMTGERRAFDVLPYFYSYQFELKIHAYGDLTSKTSIVRRGALDEKSGFFQFFFNGDVLDGVLSVNKKWDEIKLARELVLRRAKFENPSELSNESKSLSEYL